MTIKKIFLMSVIASLSVSALIGILIVLFGSLGELQAKILLTALSIGGFSLTSLCAGALYDKGIYKNFAWVSIAFSVLGFIISAILIWVILDTGVFFRIFLVLLILSIGSAHASLLLLMRPVSDGVWNSLLATLALIAIVAFMLIVIVVSDFSIRSNAYLRFLWVFIILDALGTIVTPILQKVKSMGNNVVSQN